MKTIDKYLFHAMDKYPYSLEETIESLGYALSYDSKNTMAFCLAGRIQAEQLFNYEAAKEYFEMALGINIGAREIYPYYIQTLIANADWEEAAKLIEFALTVKGINTTEILQKKILMLETQHQFKAAQEVLKQVKLQVTCQWQQAEIEIVEKRIAGKIDLLKKAERKSKRKSK